MEEMIMTNTSLEDFARELEKWEKDNLLTFPPPSAFCKNTFKPLIYNKGVKQHEYNTRRCSKGYRRRID